MLHIYGLSDPSILFKLSQKPSAVSISHCCDAPRGRSFALGLVADPGGDLALGRLPLAVDDEQKRGVHSYAPEVKGLPGRRRRKADGVTTVCKDPVFGFWFSWST